MLECHFMQWRAAARALWAVFAVTCVLYGGFAIAAGSGFVETGKSRALPLFFQLHALAGGIALITGIIQFNTQIRIRFQQAHRWIGRAYVSSAYLASIAAVINAMFFDVSLAARLSFLLLGFCWFTTTLVAYLTIINGNIALHREWVLRSFSLAFFFITFSVWVPVLAGTGNESSAAYFAAVTLSWVSNLLCAEVWIRRRRTRGDAPTR
ncbi:DUF2306 domain-containing protein [Aliiroseovarius sp. S2029]|uniref:DUF2306 domain-containing protein n=1 Tax=Aliiroseovarius sp. S2029 TaxID=2936988 RepID=UPI0020C147B0|nr:DUF2306 domain-containing protein [Aliiroseovarius sp. S2029]